jgi:quinol-cytochrome oxidoreductase complex cytochrome b subunit
VRAALPPQPPQPQPDWHLTETYKSLITLTVEALKMLALVNGGAAIAILTYLGNLASRQPAMGHLPDIKFALWCYSGGVAATTLAFIFAYATQLRLFIEERDRRGGPPRRTLHWGGVTVGILLALGAAGAFAAGSLFAATAITL